MCLDVFNPQSPYTEAILAVIAEHLEADHAYILRLKSQYALIKAVATNPNHPVQQKLANWKDEDHSVLLSSLATKAPPKNNFSILRIYLCGIIV